MHRWMYRVATLGSDTPHCGASTGIYGREPIAWGVAGTLSKDRGRRHLCSQLGVQETTIKITKLWVHLVEIGADGTYVVS